ncbi:MAG: primosomal protein N' [Stappiaceae bacterium]
MNLFDERVVPVIVPVPVGRAYSYRVPSGFDVQPGTIVRVPLGPRDVIGAVWDGPVDGDVNPDKLKDISYVYPARALDEQMRRFIEWVANWTLSTPGMVLRMVVRMPQALEPEPPVAGVRLGGALPPRMTPARQRTLDCLEGGLSWTKKNLTEAAGVSSSVVDGLLKTGTLETVLLPATSSQVRPDPEAPGPTLSDAQQAVANHLVGVCNKGYSVTLIDGVTGSGKTEVYFEAVAEVLRSGRQILILLPEISLTSQFLERFERRFNARPAEWHSELGQKKRAQVWRDVAAGTASVVVGARSALFLPFTELGLIIVDEEHDSAFKQDDRVPYNARDMAVVRGHIGAFPVLLSSATPSIESRVNADQERYHRSVLSERISGASMPDIEMVDMRQEGPERGFWLAPRLLEAIRQTCEAGAQSLLFLNRRGYAPLTLCRTCGHRFQCSNCSTWLVEHRFRGKLVCHHCGHQEQKPSRCPECDAGDSLVACGPGVERIAEEISERFPEARTLVLSSDLGGGVERLRRELKFIEQGQVDIVIGTQLVAKGLNFPLMMLVGVVDADLGLSHGDLRAAEKTYQLLAQVTGRAGRLGGKGRGILQTYAPEHPVIKAMTGGDSEAFYSAEISARKQAGLPPFGRLAGVIISAPDRRHAEDYARRIARLAPPQDGVMVLGPVEAPLALVRGRYRFRLLLQAKRTIDIQAYLRKWFAVLPPQKGGLRTQVDIDPQSFM